MLHSVSPNDRRKILIGLNKLLSTILNDLTTMVMWLLALTNVIEHFWNNGQPLSCLPKNVLFFHKKYKNRQALGAPILDPRLLPVVKIPTKLLSSNSINFLYLHNFGSQKCQFRPAKIVST